MNKNSEMFHQTATVILDFISTTISQVSFVNDLGNVFIYFLLDAMLYHLWMNGFKCVKWLVRRSYFCGGSLFWISNQQQNVW